MRKYIFDHFFEQTTPPTLEEAMQKFHLSRKDAFARFKEVEADHHILLVPGTQRILMANPYSAVTTPFRVHIGGKQYFANCAWDTVSLHVMLGKEARVDAYCHHCAEPIHMTLNKGKVVSSAPKEPLIFLSVSVAKWFDNLINTCSNNMVYFSSKEHMDDWFAENPDLTGEALSPTLMAEVCNPLSKGRMDLNYDRPPKEQTMAYWDSLGLTSPFWDF